MTEPADRWIPLFPLELVLLPGAPVPLHIYEPRYQAMTARCVDQGQLSQVGCEASIEHVLQRYPDGRQDILVRGGERVALRQIREHADGYLEGWVSRIEDIAEETDAPTRDVLLHLYEEVRRCSQEDETTGITDRSPEAAATPGADDRGYTFTLAAGLRLDLEMRQALLQTVSERERERMLIRALAQQLPAAKQVGEHRRSAKGNGKAAPAA